jgi:hypothetical protein
MSTGILFAASCMHEKNEWICSGTWRQGAQPEKY